MNAEDTVVSLRRWINNEAVHVLEQQTNRPDDILWLKKVTLLKKTTVAYGIVELLRHANILTGSPLPQSTSTSLPSSVAPEERCHMDNFAVRLSSNIPTAQQGHRPAWNNVRGVSMIAPALSARIAEPPFLSGISDGSANDDLHQGRCLEVAITPPLNEIHHRPAVGHNTASHGDDCRSFGILLYELYAGISPSPAPLPGKPMPRQGKEEDAARGRSPRGHGASGEPAKKKSTVRYDKKKGKPYARPQRHPYAALQELGFPSSVSRLVLNLIDDQDSYTTLEAAGQDLRLSLSDPTRFLFDRHNTITKNGCVHLSFREHKLYGREKEISLITDAFCRVSSGKNEAFFLGGEAGSGKTMLVKSLMARVDVAGGYVLTEKVDHMHKGMPISGVLSAFNHLCVLIREKNSPEELRDITHRLRRDFDTDFAVLARLLPRITLISLQGPPAATEEECGTQMSFYNVCFVLQRFVRVVSSVRRPVMLFLDDCQWCSAPSLELIHALLSDTRGANCFFFVGSFRDNEVSEGHPIFSMMAGLESCGVTMTRLILNGLTPEDLNTMLSDALCMFPRFCKSLSDIVFQKTKGNPFFVLEFLKALVDGRLLKYSLRERAWIWEDEEIRSEDVTDNVLYLLARKMKSFPAQVQLALKVLSCFGIKVDGAIVEFLSLTAEYSNFREWLEQAIGEGCVQRVGTVDFKFVHDKVREAAYSFIPDKGKNEFHHELGLLLYSVSRGRKTNSAALFNIVNQINRGVPNLIQKNMRHDMSALNVDAGARAMASSDYVTACSYFHHASVLLPENRWSGSYVLSLRLFFLRSKAAFSCGDIDTACASLKTILEQGVRLEDKLEAYHLYVTILTTQGKFEAWRTCCEVLSKLNETIPESVDRQTVGMMVKQTGETLSRISDEDLLNMPEMDSTLPKVLKFYQLLLFTAVAYAEKTHMLPFIACRMIKLTVDHGVCEESIIGFLQYAAVICHQSKDFRSVREACRIGKASMQLQKRFGSSIHSMPKVWLFYFGFVALFVEPIQLCTENLFQSFKVGLSSGEMTIALYSSALLMRLAMFSGENLPALLKDINYHVDVMNSLNNKNMLPYLLQYRETVATLIDKEHTGSPSDAANPCEGNAASTLEVSRWKEGMFLNRALQSFWCGYAQRCHHYATKMIKLQSVGQYNKLIISFYSALNSFRGVRNRNGTGSQFLKLKDTFKAAISMLKPVAELSPWNFRNKVHLLEAEMFSFEKKNAEAKTSYAAAITSSRASRFVHEQGLACELAGLHHKKIGEAETALHYFQRAKECYQSWGSQMKVESIAQHMNRVVSASS